jgi:hypothetical protein
MQDVIAELVRRFDIRFAEGMMENMWWEGVKDRFCHSSIKRLDTKLQK